MSVDLVCLIDVDNTLLDNDRIIADLESHLIDAFGAASADRYWAIFETLRDELGYVDYLGALQRYRAAISGGRDAQRTLLQTADFLLDYPFAERLYPGALDAVAHLARFGQTVILTDGDVVLQPHKIQRAGIWEAVDGRALVFVHKERMLESIEAQYPAQRYVVIDDKLRLLTAIKQGWGERVLTVFPRQGHYALDTEAIDAYPAADRTIEAVAELITIDPSIWQDFGR